MNCAKGDLAITVRPARMLCPHCGECGTIDVVRVGVIARLVEATTWDHDLDGTPTPGWIVEEPIVDTVSWPCGFRGQSISDGLADFILRPLRGDEQLEHDEREVACPTT